MRTKVIFCLVAALFLTPIAFAETTTYSDPHLAKAVELRAQAQSAYDSGDYDTADQLAKQAKAELALVQGKAGKAAAAALAVSPLPASYTVRLIVDDRDCLSKIAGFPFVYGDRTKWVILYRANKETLKHPENADIILPGEILVIPSIAGETREGAWVEGKQYPTFSPSK
jgi:nucleoid-associated protein YgaU